MTTILPRECIFPRFLAEIRLNRGEMRASAPIVRIPIARFPRRFAGRAFMALIEARHRDPEWCRHAVDGAASLRSRGPRGRGALRVVSGRGGRAMVDGRRLIVGREQRDSARLVSYAFGGTAPAMISSNARPTSLDPGSGDARVDLERQPRAFVPDLVLHVGDRGSGLGHQVRCRCGGTRGPRAAVGSGTRDRAQPAASWQFARPGRSRGG